MTLFSADLRYFMRREYVEREQAEVASDISVRIAHLAAADGYAARIVGLRAVTAETDAVDA